MSSAAPDPASIRAARDRLAPRIRTTPVWPVDDATFRARLGAARVHVKLELWQHAGSFKTRGVLCSMLALDASALARGVTAFSAGNHALAIAHAATIVGTHAKVVMPATANPGRIDACRDAGAEVVLVPTVHAARELVARIAADEGRTFLHPFESPGMVLGAATLGDELLDQLPDLDAVVVPIGGGGLCAGVAAAIKQRRPACAVYGVEPCGADSMTRSLAAGEPVAIPAVQTMADSLGAPRAEPLTFALCQRFVDSVATVTDDELAAAMRMLFTTLKLAVEPAAAASTAGALGPLADRLRDRNVALILCGTNTDVATFARNAKRDGAAD